MRKTPGPKAASQPRLFAAAVRVKVKSRAPRTSIRSNTASAIRLGKSPRRWAFDLAAAPEDMWQRLVGQPTPDRPDGGPLFGSGQVIAYWPEPPR